MLIKANTPRQISNKFNRFQKIAEQGKVNLQHKENRKKRL